MQYLKKANNWLYDFSASKTFFWLVLLFFTVQAVWGALSFIYPMVFDEYSHFGTTKVYAQQWSPFINEQPPEASLFGDITRDPSYLYSYLLSFPYRLLNLFIKSETGLIIILRLLNVSLVVVAIFLYRKLFLSWKISPRAVNLVILAFVSTLIVPLIAAHINYDNLMFLLSAVFLMLATKILSKKGNILAQTTLFLSIGMLTTLVKHNFIPIFVTTALFVGVTLWYRNRNHLKLWLSKAWLERPRGLIAICLAGLLLLSTGLFIERHVQNVIRYKTVAPSCDKIQPESVCKDFGPWYRNRNNIQNKPTDPLYGNPISFTQHWGSKMMRGYFAPFSHTPTLVVSEQEPFGPIVNKAILPVPIIFAIVVSVVGGLLVVVNFKKLWKNEYLRLSLIIVITFIATLWIFNFQLYQLLGTAQAIQARYTYPILMLIFVLFVVSVNYSIKSVRIKKIFLLLFITLYVWGGGIAGYLIRADDTWYWQNKTVITVNKRAQDLLRHVVIH